MGVTTGTLHGVEMGLQPKEEAEFGVGLKLGGWGGAKTAGGSWGGECS